MLVSLSKIVLSSTVLLIGSTNVVSDIQTHQNSVLEQPEHTKVELVPQLWRVCSCESLGYATGTPTHYDKKGNVLRGKINPQDIGMCQINEHYNGKQAESMGLNIYKEQDNITFANHMYKTQGLTPWKWSEHCWKE
jgi:hypothetical protein